MKCPECEQVSLQSKVYVRNGAVTCLGWQPFYDENGTYHSHNPNRHTVSYQCSEGHNWAESHLSRCPAPDCDWHTKYETACVERIAKHPCSVREMR